MMRRRAFFGGVFAFFVAAGCGRFCSFSIRSLIVGLASEPPFMIWSRSEATIALPIAMYSNSFSGEVYAADGVHSATFVPPSRRGCNRRSARAASSFTDTRNG